MGQLIWWRIVSELKLCIYDLLILKLIWAKFYIKKKYKNDIILIV
jgi:hypothetical protein